MKNKKYSSITCVLLVLFVCVSAASSAFAEGPPESQEFGVGLQALLASNSAPGVNARYWSESNFGVEGGLYAGGFRGFNLSGLYTVTHKDTDSMYIRPYVGVGILHERWSDSGDLGGYGNYNVKYTATGLNIFPGAEFTVKSYPKLSFGGDLIMIFGGKAKVSGNVLGGGFNAEESIGGVGFRINVLYYLK